MTKRFIGLLVAIAFLATGAIGYLYVSVERSTTCFELAQQNIRNKALMRERAKSAAPRHVFLDGGARHGKAIKKFKECSFYGEQPWEVIAFEANPFITHRIAKADDVVLFNQALWVEDGLLDFYLAKSTASSSVKKEKKTGGLKNTPITVESIDFSQWIRDNLSKDDTIYMKLDIEGAEYEVLDKMIADGTMAYVNKLFIEFHNEKIGIPVERDRELIETIRQLGISVVEEGTYHREANWFET